MSLILLFNGPLPTKPKEPDWTDEAIVNILSLGEQDAVLGLGDTLAIFGQGDTDIETLGESSGVAGKKDKSVIKSLGELIGIFSPGRGRIKIQ